MREILFKAKIESNDEWVFGDLFIDEYENGNGDILYECYIRDTVIFRFNSVRPETVCEYTGLKDKNGKMIFENDIVKYNWWNAYCHKNEHNERIDLVKYNDYGFYPFIENFGCDDEYYAHLIDFDSIEVIGNIFDNPELLGETK